MAEQCHPNAGQPGYSPFSGGPQCNMYTADGRLAGQGSHWIVCPKGSTLVGGVCVFDRKDLACPRPGQSAGNPCDSATGNKYQTEVDYAGSGGTPGFTRHYNSRVIEDLGLGVGWTTDFVSRLYVYGTTVQIQQGTGRGEPFTCPQTTGGCTGDADTQLALGKDGTGYTLSYRDGRIARYDTTGLMLSKSDPQGRTTSYAYDVAGHLATVTGPDGHTLGFIYDASRIVGITDSATGTYTYAYTNDNLTKVTYPGGQAKHYHYENSSFPHYLTGISYEEANGVITRYATYGYDSAGMAVLTEHAGGVERHTLSYDSVNQTTVTDAAGIAEVITFSDQQDAINGWNFNNTIDGWTTYHATLTPGATSATLVVTATDPQIMRSVSIGGTNNRFVTARIRQTAAGAWEGTIYYATSSHGYSASYRKTIPAPVGLTVGGGWVNAVWDMHNLTIGGADWKNSVITSIRLDFVSASGSFQVDWISYGGAVYPGKDLVAKLNVVDGKGVTQTLDTSRNVVCSRNAEGQVTTYVYNGTNQKTSMTEGLAGDCTTPVTTSATRTTTYQYASPTLSLPTVTSSPSVASGQTKTTTVTYGDPSHPDLPTTIAQSGFTPSGAAVSRTVSMTYNASGQVATINGPRTDVSDITTFAYYTCTTGGACGQLQSVTNALGQVTTYDTYDANGRVTQTTDPNGLRTNYTYDPRGRVTAIVQTPPAGTARITSYTYNAAGNVTSAIFPDGASLSYTYNAAQLLTRVTDNLGNYVDYGYDLKGNRTGEDTRDPSGTLVRQVATAYDIRNRVNSINAGGSLTQTVHDAIGNLVSQTDPNSNPATTHGYDALNRLAQTIDALSGTTSYGYTPTDKLAQVTAPNSATTQYVYDDLGNLLQETSPDRGTTVYTYDAAGNLLTKTDARGIAVSYTYDALNRVTSIDYPGTAEDVSYTYDSCGGGVGRLCQVTDASGTTQFAYNAFGNVTQEQKTELGVVYATSYTYDARDRVMSMTYPDGRTVSYTRDALGRIASTSATVNGANQSIVSGRSYRADGLLTGQSYGNGLSESRSYNLKGELTNQDLGSADTRVYAYDPNGNLTSLQSLPQVAAYTYDPLDRLTQDQVTSSPSSTRSFTYDPNGNRTADSAGTYSYVAASNQLSQTPTGAITLDAAGNTTGDGTYTYAYNQDGHLSQVLSGGNVIATYTYNYQRQRTRKVTAQGTTVYHYDLAGNLIAETTAVGVSMSAYVWTDAQPSAKINAGAPESLIYLHADQLGTPRLATDGSQAVVWRYEGNAFGDSAPTGSATVNLRFAGQYADGETGLYYNWNRYYDPKIGRYLSSDPIGLDGGLNTYSYAGNNPLRFTDPNGLFFFAPAIPIIVEGVINTIGAGLALAIGYKAGVFDSKSVAEMTSGFGDSGAANDDYQCRPDDGEPCINVGQYLLKRYRPGDVEYDPARPGVALYRCDYQCPSGARFSKNIPIREGYSQCPAVLPRP